MARGHRIRLPAVYNPAQEADREVKEVQMSTRSTERGGSTVTVLHSEPSPWSPLFHRLVRKLLHPSPLPLKPPPDQKAPEWNQGALSQGVRGSSKICPFVMEMSRGSGAWWSGVRPSGQSLAGWAVDGFAFTPLPAVKSGWDSGLLGSGPLTSPGP